MSTVSVIVDRRWLNSVVTGFGTVAVAIPNFVTGTILVVLFGVVWACCPQEVCRERAFSTTPESPCST